MTDRSENAQVTSNESLIAELRFAGNVKSIDPVTRDLLRRAREALEGQTLPRRELTQVV